MRSLFLIKSAELRRNKEYAIIVTDMGKLSPKHLLSTVEALAYTKVTRNTLKTHERQGHIQPVGWDGIDPRTKMWMVADLDNLKLNLGTYVGKRGRRLATFEAPQNAIELQTSIETGLMEACSVPPNFTLTQGQNVIRYQLLEMARRNKVIARLFALLDSPDGKIQLAAIEKILNKILPDLKSIEQIKTVDEGTAIRQERTVKALEAIKIHMGSGRKTGAQSEVLILGEAS